MNIKSIFCYFIIVLLNNHFFLIGAYKEGYDVFGSVNIQSRYPIKIILEGEKYWINNVVNKVLRNEKVTAEEYQIYTNYYNVMQTQANVWGSIIWIGNFFLSTIGGPLLGKFIIPPIMKWWSWLKWKKGIKKLGKKYRFSSIVGYALQKEKSKKILLDILEQKRNKKYKKNNGILFYGPPGCGKTNFVYTIASEADVPIIKVSLKELMNEQGVMADNFEILCEALQDKVKNIGPCILFFDEFDFFVANRGNQNINQNEKIVIQDFLTKLEDAENLAGVFVMACTNDTQAIDDALLRDGRLGVHIEVDLPTKEDVELFYDKYCALDESIKKMRKNEIVNSSIGLSCVALIEKFSHLK